MKKMEFIAKLRSNLIGLPYEDARERINFYSEMIADRMEDGLTEEEAVANVGSVDEIAAEIKNEFLSVRKNVGAAKKKINSRIWVGILIALGSPLWLSLLISAFAVTISLYAVLWSVILSLWSAVFAFAVSGIASVPMTVIFLVKATPLSALGAFGIGAFAAGLSVLGYYGTVAATKAALRITKISAAWMINKFKK